MIDLEGAAPQFAPRGTEVDLENVALVSALQHGRGVNVRQGAEDNGGPGNGDNWGGLFLPDGLEERKRRLFRSLPGTGVEALEFGNAAAVGVGDGDVDTVISTTGACVTGACKVAVDVQSIQGERNEVRLRSAREQNSGGLHRGVEHPG